MADFNIKPPRINIPLRGGFWKQLGMLVLGTTISLIFTLAAAKLTEDRQRAKDRRLSAMMVMSNIECFARTLDIRSDNMATSDSIAAWLLNTPTEDLELMPGNELLDLINKATQVAYLAHDKTAENVFSNNIETWKNVGNVQFIDLVGSCFSAMNNVEDQFNEWAKGVAEAKKDVAENPDDYEGSTYEMRCMHSDRVRSSMASVHNRRGWLKYAAATLRFFNLKNMDAIGISEEEVMEYTDSREKEDEEERTPPMSREYYTPAFTLDSLTTLQHLTQHIEELKNERR